MQKIILYIFLWLSLVFNAYFIYENNNLKEQVRYLKQQNDVLKETPEIYWQNAIEKFNNKKYTETKEILNKLIEKFPNSNLIKKSQEKIKEINSIEKKKKDEEQRIINSLSKQIINAKNALIAEEILNDLDKKYDATYSKLKNFITEKRNELKEKIKKEKQKQKTLQQLGIQISEIKTYWNFSEGKGLLVPFCYIKIKNISPNLIRSLIVKGSFNLVDKKETFGNATEFVINQAPLSPNYSVEVFLYCNRGYYYFPNEQFNFPNITMDLYISVNSYIDVFIDTLKIKKGFRK